MTTPYETLIQAADWLKAAQNEVADDPIEADVCLHHAAGANAILFGHAPLQHLENWLRDSAQGLESYATEDDLEGVISSSEDGALALANMILKVGPRYQVRAHSTATTSHIVLDTWTGDWVARTTDEAAAEGYAQRFNTEGRAHQ